MRLVRVGSSASKQNHHKGTKAQRFNEFLRAFVVILLACGLAAFRLPINGRWFTGRLPQRMLVRCNKPSDNLIMHPSRPLFAAAFLLLSLPAFAQQTLPPLRTAVDGTYAPHAMPKLGGGLEGFQIDLFNEVARRMHRGITINSASFSGLIPALEAGRYDFLAAPTTVTPERAQNLLFTQGYLWTAFEFGIRKGSAPIKDWSDLKGKAVAVNKGTPYETLSRKMGEQYGFHGAGVRHPA